MIGGNLKISQLRAFITVAETGNFSAAALELGLSQSSVSHAIACLEAELGVLLLVRGRHGAALTAIGTEILADARQVLQLLEAMHQKARLNKSLQHGQVRIASVRSIATHFLPEVLVQFQQQFPTIHVLLHEFEYYTRVEQELREGRADIGFTLLPAPPEFETWELCHDEFVVLLPPNTLPPDVPLTWAHLTTLPLIMTPSAPPHQHTRLILDHAAQFGYSLQVAYEMKEDSTVISMVKRGLGGAIMAQLAAEPIPEGIQVRSLPVPLIRTLGMITLVDTLLPQAVFVFLDTLKTVFKQHALKLQSSELTEKQLHS